MKVPFKKPAPALRVGMEVIPHTHRTKTVRDAFGVVIAIYETATIAYPAGHPMRVYKDAKRALKRGE
jgi:hypothetical protein